MRKLFILLLIAFTSVGLYAQSVKKEVIAVQGFSHSNSIGTSFVESLRNKVIEGFVKTDRLMVKDLQAVISVPQDASAVFSESNVATLKNLNITHVVQGHVTTFTCNRMTKDGKTYYKADVAYDLKIYNIDTKMTTGQKSFTATGNGDTEAAALTSGSNGVAGEMGGFVEENFKLLGKILEISSSKKDKAQEVFIDLGTDVGVLKGQRFDVFIERTVAGRKSSKDIGGLRVTEVQGVDLSLCKVSTGGEEIQKAINEGSTVSVRSKPPGLISF